MFCNQALTTRTFYILHYTFSSCRTRSMELEYSNGYDGHYLTMVHDGLKPLVLLFGGHRVVVGSVDKFTTLTT